MGGCIRIPAELQDIKATSGSPFQDKTNQRFRGKTAPWALKVFPSLLPSLLSTHPLSLPSSQSSLCLGKRLSSSLRWLWIFWARSLPWRVSRAKTVTFTWEQEVLWSTLWKLWTMSPFIAKRQAANVCRPSTLCKGLSIMWGWTGHHPARTITVSLHPRVILAPLLRPSWRCAGQSGGSPARGDQRQPCSAGMVLACEALPGKWY